MAIDPNNTSNNYVTTYFEPSRISELTIRHQLDLQRLRITAEANGWSKWTDGDRLEISSQGKRPDAVVQNVNGSAVAIECERTIKTQKRYQQILSLYLQAIKRGEFSQVIWVSPNIDITKRLRNIICGIKTISIQGQRVTIDPDRHHKNLRFVSYDEWPNYSAKEKSHE